MKFRMNITQEVIDTAEIREPKKCAFAKAYNELVPNVSVNHSFINFMDRNGNFIANVKLPPDQRRFIEAFDHSRAVPSDFEVEIPDIVVDYWYQSHADAAQKIANSTILQKLV